MLLEESVGLFCMLVKGSELFQKQARNFNYKMNHWRWEALSTSGVCLLKAITKDEHQGSKDYFYSGRPVCIKMGITA